jgi:hypothetical protein
MGSSRARDRNAFEHEHEPDGENCQCTSHTRLDQAQQEQPGDDRQFAVTFRLEASDTLTPRLEELNKAVSAPVMDKTLVPATLSRLGAADGTAGLVSLSAGQ